MNVKLTTVWYNLQLGPQSKYMYKFSHQLLN